MDDAPANSTFLQNLLNRLQAGDPAAREALVRHACDRLLRLTRKILRTFPGVHRWEQTDDVLQNALMRLHKQLDKSQPGTVRGFFQLAGRLIRHELIDLRRHYLGPNGLGTKYESGRDLTSERAELQSFLRFHELVEGLPAEELEVTNLLHYQQMSIGEAASCLGVSERTVKRRWRSARLLLEEQLRDLGPLT